MTKWICAFIGFLVGILIAQFGIITLISALLTNSSRDLKLKVEELVGSDSKMDEDSIVISDVLFPAWNEDDRYPLFFSIAHKNHKSQGHLGSRSEYMMSLSQMITASASNGVYFNPYIYRLNDTYAENIIGGGSIAESPALYAFFSAEQFIGVDPKKISMTVIGALHKDTEKISGNVNPIQWLNRIIALTSPVKKQTQEYMVEHIIKHNQMPF